jgi:hypothetical protein
MAVPSIRRPSWRRNFGNRASVLNGEASNAQRLTAEMDGCLFTAMQAR